MASRDPGAHWDRQAELYASAEGHRPFGRFLELYEEMCWSYIKPLLPNTDGSLILEAGCGTGRWVLRLAPMGHRLVLADLSPQMIEQARAKVDRLGLGQQVASFHVLDICDLHALRDSSFDLSLALGGPLSLCRNAKLAVHELRRVTQPQGHIICDVANRYRTALELVRDGEVSQLAQLLCTGQFSRPDGLTDHRFEPQELRHLFESAGLKVIHLAGICPFFDYLPRPEHLRTLDDEQAYRTVLDVSKACAQEPPVTALSGRLLIVAQRCP